MIKLYEGNETYRVILQSTGQEFLLTDSELEELSCNSELEGEIKGLEREVALWQDDYNRVYTLNVELERETVELSEIINMLNTELEDYKFRYEELCK